MATVNIFDMADTWNNVATTYTAIKMNVTDTASASGSLLMDLQVGGSSKFKVSKTSQLLLGGAAGDTVFTDGVYASNWLSLGGTSNATQVQMRSGIFVFRSDVLVSWSNDTSFSTQDLFLTRKAAANLRLGAADAASPVAQTLSVQSVVAGTSNTAGANLTITGSQGTGTGAGGSIIFQVAPAGSSGTAQNALATALTIDSNKYVTIGSSGGLYSGGGNSLYLGNTPNFGGAFRLQDTVGVAIPSNLSYRWSSDTTSYGTADVTLFRDAANTLALRNGANAQELRVYKTTTGTVYKALLGDNKLIKIAGEAFTDGAGANTGTLTNSPVTGNPTKWIPIDDNGTTRYIPAW